MALAPSLPASFLALDLALTLLPLLPHSYKSLATSAISLPSYKVLTRLAEDPSADITHGLGTGGATDEQDDGGVECSTAHAMLMRFATSEDKLDVVSQALEYGCVGKSGGGCKVRNEVIWKAMNDVT